MQRYSNTTGVPLSIAVWLATDSYDYNDDPHTISVTTLMKPLRQIILASRVPDDMAAQDLLSMTASRMGTAIHNGVEQAWTGDFRKALAILGYPPKTIAKVLVNPKPEDLFDGCIPVYLEQRTSKKVGKWTVTGKFDFVGDGRVEDVKSTSTYTYTAQTNVDKYPLQGSLYRWLNPKLITADEIAIQYIFTDWSAARARTETGYPPTRTLQQLFPLKSIAETDLYVRRKLALLDKYWDAPEEEIPHCDDADLWRSEPVFKYYKGGAITSRSTKNFATMQEALIRKNEDGGSGLVVEKKGEVTACKYCPAFPVCRQKDALVQAGDLVL